MATYKVSYKMLAKQGEELKAAAKLVDGYAERVNQIRGKLGEDQMLAEVRNNLQKLNTQLVESRAVLNTAGGLLTSTVEKYTSTETRQVKKVDSLKAHNRDFYKNPVTVASAGGAVASGAQPTTTVNYTETNTVNYTQTTVVAAEPAFASSIPAVEPTPAAVNTAAAPAAAKAGVGNIAGIAAGTGVVGGAIGTGAVLGVKHLMDENKKDKETEKAAPKSSHGGYDPEKELAAAMERVRKLEEEE